MDYFHFALFIQIQIAGWISRNVPHEKLLQSASGPPDVFAFIDGLWVSLHRFQSRGW